MTIAVIGLGGAGGNIANEAAKLNIAAGAINYSQKDLDSLDEVKSKIKLMGSDGAGHNRDLATELMQQHHATAVKYVKDNFSDASIIFLPFATSGGSGSGIAPMLSELLAHEMPDTIIVPMPVLPEESEPLLAQENAYNAMLELSRLELFILPIDNNQVKLNRKLYKNKLFEVANVTAVSLLHKIKSYTDKASKNGNFDTKDLITLFSRQGIGAIAEVEIAATTPKATLSVQGVADNIFNSWEQSVFAPIEYIQAAACGFIFDGQEALVPYIDYNIIFNKFKYGAPLDIFEGYYGDHNGRIITIFSGLPWCMTRMSQIERIIEQGQEKAEVAIENMEKGQFSTKTFSLNEKLRGKKEKSGSALEILGKYRSR